MKINRIQNKALLSSPWFKVSMNTSSQYSIHTPTLRASIIWSNILGKEVKEKSTRLNFNLKFHFNSFGRHTKYNTAWRTLYPKILFYSSARSKNSTKNSRQNPPPAHSCKAFRKGKEEKQKPQEMLGKAQYSQLKKCQRFQPVQYRLHRYYKISQILWKLIAFFQECQKLPF